MAAALMLEIVTPKGRALSVEADEVTVPSVDGEFGVLPGHLPTLAAMRPGIVAYRHAGSEWYRYAVGGGFAEVGADRVLLLADEFSERATIDPVLVLTELKEVQAEILKLEAIASDPAQTEAVANLRKKIDRENWLAVMLDLYGNPAPPTMRPYEQFGPPAADVADESPDDAAKS